MLEVIKSKSMVGFIIFVLGVVYISTPSINYAENEKEISLVSDETVYNI